jgi:hypothetical protein
MRTVKRVAGRRRGCIVRLRARRGGVRTDAAAASGGAARIRVDGVVVRLAQLAFRATGVVFGLTRWLSG